jgi:phosphoglycolate phosphatase
MPTPKLIVLDWDGTLLNTAQRIVTSMQEAAQEVKLPQPSDESVRQIIGLELGEAIKRIFKTQDLELVEKVKKWYSQFYVNSKVEIPLFPHVENTLQKLKARGILLAVATGKSRAGLDRHIAELAWGELFSCTRCADDAPSKPNPEMLRQILAQLNIGPHEAVMVGDTTYDLEMAQAMGMPSIGVLYGVHSKEQLNQFKPKALIREFQTLLNIEALLF